MKYRPKKKNLKKWEEYFSKLPEDSLAVKLAKEEKNGSKKT